MARTSLAALLPPVSSADDVEQVPVTVGAAVAADRPARGDTQAPRTEEDGQPTNSGPGPRYLQLERKEARIRLDQADALAHMTRRLNRARSGGGERITDNTLIRVAVDVLLEQSSRLVGTTEEELRQSLSL